MTKLSTYLLLGTLTLAAASCHKADPPPQTAQEKIQAAVDKVRKKLSDSLRISFPSVNLLIQTSNSTYFASSRSESAQQVTPDTYFRFASDTKNFTAASIMNMHEDGWLDYQAKITDLIPGTKTSYTPSTSDWEIPFKNDITIKLLLQHAAGVKNIDAEPVPGTGDMSYTAFTQDADPEHQFTTGEMVKVLSDFKLYAFKPGEDYTYSNTGYSILAEIIKRVYSAKSGKEKTYADYLQDYIIGNTAPAPLPKVRFPFLASDKAMPDPHLYSTILTETGPEKYDAYNMSAQLGEGNGWGTMSELNKYVRTMMKGQNVLKPETVQLMQHQTSKANPNYGLGTSYTKNLGYGHDGARIGFLNLMAYDPIYDVSVVVMIPLYDLRDGFDSFLTCALSLSEAAYGAREALGFPGKP